MRFKIVIYLFLFVCILLFYQIINTNRILSHQDKLIQSHYQTQKKLKDSLKNLQNFKKTHFYFSIEGNPKIKLEPTNIIFLKKDLRDQLFEMNITGELKNLIELPKGNFLIEYIKIVNQDWALIGFNSDTHWGQAILKFNNKKGKSYNFETLNSFVKPL